MPSIVVGDEEAIAFEFHGAWGEKSRVKLTLPFDGLEAKKRAHGSALLNSNV